jgi:hypothetical protein
MKILIIILIFFIVFLCKTHQPVIVENTKIEYRNIFNRDSTYVHDSIHIQTKKDTVFYEQFRYFYIDKTKIDTLFVSDTITVRYPIEVIKYKSKPLTSFQNFQIWTGRISLLFLLLLSLLFVFKRK